MSFNKKFFTTGGIVAASEPAEAAFDPLQNFETVLYTGNGSTQKVNGYIRKGAAFNGSSSEILVSNFLDIPENSITISAWFQKSTSPTSREYICAISGNGSQEFFGLHMETDGTIGVSVQDGTNTQDQVNTPSISYDDGNWHHIVGIRTGSGEENLDLYVDGLEIAHTDVVDKGSGANLDFTRFEIGKNSKKPSDLFNGKIDQVRIFDKALSSGEVTTLYNEDYDSSTKSTTDIFGDGSGIALYEFEDSADDTGVGFDGVGQAAHFNGSSSKITSSASIISGNQARSISAWYKTTTSNTTLIRFGAISANQDWTVNITDASTVDIFGHTSAYDESFTSITPNLISGDWTHIAVTYDGNTGGTLKLYVNGDLEGTINRGAGKAYNTASGMVIGERGGIRYFNGQIDQVRIYSSELDSDDVDNLYNESNVPTANLLAHYKLDGDATDEQGSYDGTASNVTFGYDGTPTNVDFLGMAFQPDFVWIKTRSTNNGHVLHDSIRGASKFLSSDSTGQEGTLSGYLDSFDSNGFTLGASSNHVSWNKTGDDYVAWCWKAGGTVSADNNTNGDITSTVSANQAAGFSIVKYTGNSSFGQSVGHGLSEAPEMIFFKNLSINRDWRVYNHTIGATKYLQLDSNVGAGTFGSFNNTDPTSEVFYTTNSASADTATNNSGNNYIAYCFHSVDSYQKVGSFQGTGSTLPNTITGLGFQPRFLLLKNSTGAYEWVIKDSVRGAANELYPNDSTAENGKSDVSNITFNSDGFSVNVADGATNQNNATIIYLAIA